MLSTSRPCTANVGRPGRPKYQINEATLLNLRALGFTWTKISDLLLVSRSTLYRRVRELNLEQVTGYSEITDSELYVHVIACKNLHGITCGRSMVLGYLRGLGVCLF